MQPPAFIRRISERSKKPSFRSNISFVDVGPGFTNEEKFYILKALNYETLESLDNLPVAVSFMMKKIEEMGVDEAIGLLRDFIAEHSDDANISYEELDFIHRLVTSSKTLSKDSLSTLLETCAELAPSQTSDSFEEKADTPRFGVKHIFDWELQARTHACIITLHSPYPEVRAVTDAYDDPQMYCETPRVYILGTIFVVVGTFINTFFRQRNPYIVISTDVIQFLLYPAGILLAKILPKWKLTIFKRTIDLNPGPWNHKEQMLATAFFSVSRMASQVIYLVPSLTLPVYYNLEWSTWGYQIFLILGSNLFGYAFAGLLRRLVVYPSRAIWPTVMPVLALNKALLQPEPTERINGWTISRRSLFFITFALSFLYTWIPDFLFTALAQFNWIAWIAPNNLNVATICGGVTGLGLNPVASFDWGIINQFMAMVLPFYATLNMYIGSLVAFCCIAGMWYLNFKWTAFLPINSNNIFNNKGQPYSIKKILGPDLLFDKQKYESYGPPFYSAANLMTYGSSFALYPFAIIFVFLQDWSHISSAFRGYIDSVKAKKSIENGNDDGFNKAMLQYKDVPDWVFAIILGIAIIFSVLCITLYPTQTPVWAIFVALIIHIILLVPVSIVASTTGVKLSLNTLTEILLGFIVPGNGLAMMFNKALTFSIDRESQGLLAEFKACHYLKVNPRALFRCQILGILISSFVSLYVINFSMEIIPQICTSTQPDQFTCPSTTKFFTASVMWGLIGPFRIFSPEMYRYLAYCTIIGVVLAPICHFIKRKYSYYSAIKYFQPCLFFNGLMGFAPYNLSYYTPGMTLSFFFMHIIRNRYHKWFRKYNYVLSGSLTTGLAFSGIIIFFSLQYRGYHLTWWGNTVNSVGLDAKGPTLLNVSSAPDGYFGPRSGHFPI